MQTFSVLGIQGIPCLAFLSDSRCSTIVPSHCVLWMVGGALVVCVIAASFAMVGVIAAFVDHRRINSSSFGATSSTAVVLHVFTHSSVSCREMKTDSRRRRRIDKANALLSREMTERCLLGVLVFCFFIFEKKEFEQDLCFLPAMLTIHVSQFSGVQI